MRLNPKIFHKNTMKPQVRKHLLDSAQEFIESLGVPVHVMDITLTGSNASYNYTPKSDLDVHVVIDDSKLILKSVWQQLFGAKKLLWKEQRKVSIKQIPVEMYVQLASEPHVSDGVYSILKNKWIQKPRLGNKLKHNIKLEKALQNFAKSVLKQTDPHVVQLALEIIAKMRQISLAMHGPNNAYNNAFRSVRSMGLFDAIRYHARKLRDKALTIENQTGETANEKASHQTRIANQKCHSVVGGAATFGSSHNQTAHTRTKTIA